MALSYVTYAGDGATTNFTYDKGYYTSTDVDVYVDGVLQTFATDWNWFNTTTIQFTVAPASAAAIRIQRETDRTARLVDFQDAANLTESDLDNSANQMFYIAQEVLDASEMVELTTQGFMSAVNTTLTFAHSLVTVPGIVEVRLRCLTADAGYAVNDEVMLPSRLEDSSGNVAGCSYYCDATNVYVQSGNDAGYTHIMNASTGAYTAITPANWDVVVRVRQ